MALGGDLRLGARTHEHADPPALVEMALLDEQAHPLAHGRRVDAQSRRELVRRGNLRILGEHPAQDVVLDLFGDLDEEGLMRCHGAPAVRGLVDGMTNQSR